MSLACCRQKADEPFFFVQVTDTQMGFREKHGEVERSVEYLSATVDRINDLHPAFVVVTGDMVNNWNSSVQLAAYDSLMSRIASNIPVYTIPGNHDFRPAKEPESAEAYHEHFGQETFCFEYHKSLFLGYNSCLIKEDDAEKEAAQYSWIVSQLEKYRPEVEHIFLFSHCAVVLEERDAAEDYFYYQEPYRSKYLKLCRDYNVDAVFSGHYHRTRSVTLDGTQYVTCTASGEPLGDGFTGINTVGVWPDRFTWSVTSPADAVNPLRK